MPADVEPLAFASREGPTHNSFFRHGAVAAHLVATSGTARVVVAFPAGNTGAGLWFEPRPEPVAVSPLGPLGAVEEGAMRGVSTTLEMGTRELRVRRAVLGSVRALREVAHHGDSPLGFDARVSAGPPFTLARTTVDGRHRIALRLAPHGGASVAVDREGRLTLTAAPGEPLRITLTALADDPPLTPIPAEEILVDGVTADTRARAALAFLSYEEKLLAGSWRFLTYFGRDTLLTLRLLLPALRPRVIEAGLGAVLDRLGPEGDVAHEEAIGEWATTLHLGSERPPADLREPILDRSMVDDDFLLAPVAAAYLLGPAGCRRARDFLDRRTPGGDSYRAALAKNLALVMRRAAPFAADRSPRSLVALQEGRLTGDWRDSEEGLGGGRFPFNVNAALVPAALDAAARLLASGLVEGSPGAAERARGLACAYAGAGDLFRVRVPADEARRRIAACADAMGIDPAPALASVHGEIVFPGISLDEAGQPVAVMHSDDGFALLFTDPSPASLEEAAARIVRPFPAGLSTPAGLLVANPAFCPSRAVRDSFTPAHYHGTVVWSFQHALLAAGVRRQLGRLDLPLSTRAALSMARGALADILRASEGWRTSELWSVGAQAGRLVRVPFGALRAHHDESNAAQLWSVVTGIGSAA